MCGARTESVFNGIKEEATCGGGRSGLGAIACGEYGGNVLDAHVTASDVEHGSDEIADHVVEESVAADAIDEKLQTVGGLGVPTGGEDRANGGAGFSAGGGIFGFDFAASCEVGIGCGEALEIVFAEEGLGGALE